MISFVFAWIATVAAILTALKFVAKKNPKLNRFFHQIHIPAGEILIAAGLIHGLFAGNVIGTKISDARIAPLLFTVNAGTVCFLLSILLALSYVFRKTLKANWMILHRILTVCMIAVLVFHISQVGIQLPQRILSAGKSTAIEPGQSDGHALNTDANTFSNATLKDGIYTGSAEGFKSTISVSVTVEGGKVVSIEITDENDTPSYMDRAEAITDDIVREQSLEIDTISGATYSSKGILDAVADALQNAVIDGELSKNQTVIPNDSGHGKHPGKGPGKGLGKGPGKGPGDKIPPEISAFPRIEDRLN